MLLLAIPCRSGKVKIAAKKKIFDEFTAIQRSANFRKEACTRAAVLYLIQKQLF